MLIAPPAVPRPAKEERRPAQDLDLFGEEILANADGRIAHAVDEDVVARIEAADEEAISEGVAAFARAERHAGGRARDLAERGGILVFQEFLGENRDGSRRVEDGLRELGRGEAIGLVGRRRVGIGVAARRKLRGGRSAGVGRGHGRCVVLRGAGSPRGGRRCAPSRASASAWRPVAVAGDRRIDRHGLELLLSFCAADGCGCDHACDCRGPRWIDFRDGQAGCAICKLEAQGSWNFYCAHFNPHNIRPLQRHHQRIDQMAKCMQRAKHPAIAR